MWIALAVMTFIAGQIYLFRCLKKMDRYLERQSGSEPEKEVLSIAFADPGMAESLTGFLEGFSKNNPDIDMVLRTDRNVLNAVYDGSAAIGFLPAGQDSYPGLRSFALNRIAQDMPAQDVVWKCSVFSAPADAFVRYLCDSGAVSGRNPG